MADIRVTVNGDSSGAEDAMQRTADATGQATEKFRLMSVAVSKVASAAVAFAKDSVKAYAEAEKVSRQLQRATGDLSAAFEAQALVLSKKNAVDDNLIKKQQTLLAQWGAAPKDIGAASQAILDYAAATGQDAVSATQSLITSVEAGGGALKKLGVHFDATGDKEEDLRRATKALAATFGGAGEANANTLQGRADEVSNAFGELQESFGGLVDLIDGRLGVLSGLSQMLRDIAYGATVTIEALKQLGIEYGKDAMTGGGRSMSDIVGTAFTNAALTAKPKDFVPDITGKGKGGRTNYGMREGGTGEGGTGEITASGKLGEDDGTYSAWEKWQMEQEKAAQKATDQLVKGLAEHTDEAWAAEAAARGKDADTASGLIGFVVGDLDKEAAAQSAQVAAVGESLGATFVNALTGELNKLAAGGEFDIVGFISGLLPAIGGLFGPIGAAIGGLAGAGLNLVGAQSRRHDGGWIGAPRFHSGGWPGVGADEVPAVLQSGERVLSRGEVSAMGGPGGVERAARGGGRGGVTINISSLDTKSTREFFEDRGGQGFQDAIRSGRGDVARILGGGLVY